MNYWKEPIQGGWRTRRRAMRVLVTTPRRIKRARPAAPMHKEAGLAGFLALFWQDTSVANALRAPCPTVMSAASGRVVGVPTAPASMPLRQRASVPDHRHHRRSGEHDDRAGSDKWNGWEISREKDYP